MSTPNHTDQNWVRSLLRGVIIVASVAALYLLCFGPALSLAQRGVVPLRFVLRVYSPLPLSFQQQYLSSWARFDSRCSSVYAELVNEMVQKRFESEFGNRAALMRTLQAQGMTYERLRQHVKQEIETKSTKP
jgi:hypothetical protein